ncbi:MAG: transcriptional regulator NrdR, partial [Anaerolineae bacterium]
MKCPYCIKGGSRVIDTRQVGDGIRRRRECQACGRRFTTYERVASVNLLVVKRDGRREEFDREKLMAGLHKACAKRPISAETLEQVVSQIEGELYSLGRAEVESRVIGEKVMERLRALDDVAYVRFASVYRRFHDVDSLAAEIQALKERKRREEELKR